LAFRFFDAVNDVLQHTYTLVVFVFQQGFLRRAPISSSAEYIPGPQFHSVCRWRGCVHFSQGIRTALCTSPTVSVCGWVLRTMVFSFIFPFAFQGEKASQL